MKLLIAILLCAFGFNALKAQDINFSQFYEMPLLRNPALAGTFKGDIRVTSAFRTQWSSVTTPYNTGGLGTEIRFAVGENSDNYVSAGFQITHDVAGDSKLTKSQALPMFAFHKSLNSEKDQYLTLGVLAGVVQQRFDPSGLRFSDQFVSGAYRPSNPTREAFATDNFIYGDATVGLSFSSMAGYDTRYYVGAALFHLTEPKVAFNPNNDIRLNKKLVFNAGISAPVGEYDRIIIYVDYFMQGGNSQAQGGVFLRKDLDNQNEDLPISLYVGGFYRWNDAVIPVIKLDYYKFGFGFTYDMNMSKLKTASQGRGGIELTMTYRNFLNVRSSSLQKTRCPQF